MLNDDDMKELRITLGQRKCLEKAVEILKQHHAVLPILLALPVSYSLLIPSQGDLSSGSNKNITDISNTLTKNNDESDESFTGDLRESDDDYHDVSFQYQEGTDTEDLVRVSSSDEGNDGEHEVETRNCEKFAREKKKFERLISDTLTSKEKTEGIFHNISISSEGIGSAHCHYCDVDISLGNIEKGFGNFTKHTSTANLEISAGESAEDKIQNVTRTVLSELEENAGNVYTMKGGRLYCRACGKTFFSKSVKPLLSSVKLHDVKIHKSNAEKKYNETCLFVFCSCGNC